MFKFFIPLFVLIINVAYAAKELTQDDAFNLGKELADSSSKANDPFVTIKNFEAEVVTKADLKEYTNSPKQTKYYHGVTAGSSKDLLDDGHNEYRFDEDDTKNNAPQAALKSFAKNPRVKIDPNNPEDPIIGRAKNILKNASDIVIGKAEFEGSKQSRDPKTCKIQYTQKTCNEQKGLPEMLLRVCEKYPVVKIVDEQYLGCNGHTSPGEVKDCLAGTVQIPHYHQGNGYGSIVLPKKRGARVGFSDSRHPYYYITATNAATGQQVIPRRQVSNGFYIELPTSETADQTFNFVIEPWDQCNCDQPGRMNIYINQWRKVPEVKWEEGHCHDI